MARQPRENWINGLPSNPDRYDMKIATTVYDALEERRKRENVANVILGIGALLVGSIIGVFKSKK